MPAPLNWGASGWKRNGSLIKQALAPLRHHLRYRRCRQRLVTNLVLHLYTTHCIQHTQQNCHMLYVDARQLQIQFHTAEATLSTLSPITAPRLPQL